MLEYIPTAYRRRIYVTFAIVGLILGATQVGYGAAEAGQPTWLTVALAVFGFASGAVGYVAQKHTPSP